MISLGLFIDVVWVVSGKYFPAPRAAIYQTYIYSLVFNLLFINNNNNNNNNNSNDNDNKTVIIIHRYIIIIIIIIIIINK
jgi:hypothetical protein